MTKYFFGESKFFVSPHCVMEIFSFVEFTETFREIVKRTGEEEMAIGAVAIFFKQYLAENKVMITISHVKCE